MIVTKFKLFHVKSEMFFRYTMIFQHSFFSKAPKSFNIVNIDSIISKSFSMVKAEMPVVDKQRLVASKSIRIKYTSFLGIFPRRFKYFSQTKIFRKIGK